MQLVLHNLKGLHMQHKLHSYLLSSWYFYNSIFLFLCHVISHDIARLGCCCTGVIAWALRLHNTAVVMENKHFITLVSVHIVIIALVGCIFAHLRLMKIPHPLVQSLAILHANSCNKVCTFMGVDEVRDWQWYNKKKETIYVVFNGYCCMCCKPVGLYTYFECLCVFWAKSTQGCSSVTTNLPAERFDGVTCAAV